WHRKTQYSCVFLVSLGLRGNGKGWQMGFFIWTSLVIANLFFVCFTEMWYGVFLWALLSSVFIYVPAGLLGFVMLRHHKYGRFISLGIIGGILGPIIAAVLTSAAIAGVYRAAAKQMVPLEALVLGIGQIFFVVAIAFLRILATL
uniref:Transmembrane protein 170A n=1 Tax=Callorhinchus milii TaxID=7868 RepID=A0A4W3K2U5_CALMI